jgi:hypothetical protein
MSRPPNPVVRDANQVDASGRPPLIFRGATLDHLLLCSMGGSLLFMNRLRLRIARIALALGVAALCWACNAPFIPIPPPGRTASFSSQLVPDGSGGQKTVWTAHGDAYKPASFARIFVFDTDRGAGVIAQALADGSYASPPMDGTAGDRIDISFETPASALSMSVCFLLVDGPSAPVCPSP